MLVALCERYSVEVTALKELPLVANSFEAWRLHRLKDIVYDQVNSRSSDKPIKRIQTVPDEQSEFYVARQRWQVMRLSAESTR